MQPLAAYDLKNDLVWQNDGATHWADLAEGLLRLQVVVSEHKSITSYSLQLRGGSGQIQGSDAFSLALAKDASIKLLLGALADMGIGLDEEPTARKPGGPGEAHAA
ncbi:MAG TPA: hypothetical protein VF171_08775 [Trueperaceae bacterium]